MILMLLPTIEQSIPQLLSSAGITHPWGGDCTMLTVDTLVLDCLLSLVVVSWILFIIKEGDSDEWVTILYIYFDGY